MDAREIAGFALLVPLGDPLVGADDLGFVEDLLASALVPSPLLAHYPLVVFALVDSLIDCSLALVASPVKVVALRRSNNVPPL